MADKKPRIGFDLDGVILYNPARIARPFVAIVKEKILGKKKEIRFYVPKTKFEEFLWYIFHKSSFITAPGLKELKTALKQKDFEAYIITARFDSLRQDFEKWMNKIDAQKYFTGYFHNKNNEQPHIFKKKMIEKLDLDIFVDDNWDIVQYLKKEFKDTNKKIYWIYNLFDRKLDHPKKFPHLKHAVEDILNDLKK